MIEEDSSSEDESDDEGGQTAPLPTITTEQTGSQAMSPRDNTSDTRMYSCENCGLLLLQVRYCCGVHHYTPLPAEFSESEFRMFSLLSYFRLIVYQRYDRGRLRLISLTKACANISPTTPLF